MRPPFRCLWCEEMVVPGDLMHSLLPGHHYACALRATLGSIGHLQGTCSCYVSQASTTRASSIPNVNRSRDGISTSYDSKSKPIDPVDHYDDPPGLTKRQAARIVADYVRHQQTPQPGKN